MERVTSGNGETIKIISGLPLTPEQLNAIREAGGELLIDDAASDEDRAVEQAGLAEVWFGPGLTPRALRAAQRLRWLQTASVGVEYFLFPELVASSVEITSVRHRHTPAAEHALALLLAIARQLPRMVRQQEAREWEMPLPSEVLSVSGARALIVGTGQIGTAVASRAAAFDMICAGVNRSGHAAAGFTKTYPARDLAAAVEEVDYVINCCPLTPETKGLFSKTVFRAARHGVVFVNVGRGKTVDQEALLSALQSGQVGAAGLDVFVDEPLPVDHPFWALPNVLITPHSAGVVPGVEVRQLGVDALLSNLPRFRAREPLIEPIDKVLGY